MRRAIHAPLLMIAGLGVVLAGGNCSSYGENESPTPTEAGGSSDGAGANDLPGCDASKDPREEKCLLAEGSSSVFVSTHGNDGAAGTRAAPVLTIERGVALAIEAKKARLIVCDGTYPEVVQIKSNVSTLPDLGIHGGFDCLADWAPINNRTRVLSRNPIAMRISPSTTRIKLRDLDLAAANADASFKQSIGLALTNANVDIKRVRITTGNGFDAIPASAPPSNRLEASALTGLPASAALAGSAKTCACPRFGSSTGARGGNSGFDGDNGSMVPPSPPLANNAGRVATPGACKGGSGKDGSAGDAGVGATTIGTMDPLGFIESSGGAGGTGLPGQGGGGGAGVGGGAGGGGGCGSCGATGGALGEAGGSSIGILAWRSKLTIAELEIQTGNGGNGARGGDAEATLASSGVGGVGSIGGCEGGTGGAGGLGGGGGGGAGGSTFGILYFDEAPLLLDGVPVASSPTQPFVRLGNAGTGGLGGAGSGGSTGNGSKGVDGRAAAVFSMPNELVKQ